MTIIRHGVFILGAVLLAGPSSNTRVTDREVKPIPAYLNKSLAWLAAAQFDNGGWGSGSHSRQEIRDPKAVQIDPGTTAFSAMALLRAGNTLEDGQYAKNVSKALFYLLDLVEASPEQGANITPLTGTQPQTKMGQNIDVALCSQFFTRILPHAEKRSSLKKRVAAALDKCLRKIERGQTADGSWAGAGWAGVLQSAMSNSALEEGRKAGRPVDEAVLQRSREYQKGNLDPATGEVRTESAAGVSLYSITSNQRAVAPEAREAEDLLNEAKRKGDLSRDAPMSIENLVKSGATEQDAERYVNAYRQNKTAKRLLQDESVLAGFGNNGGEEYLSYMMTAESMVITGDPEYRAWHETMSRRFEKVREANGSWTGHHCITSPVFCTAAVILTLTADRDMQTLQSEQRKGAR